MMMRLIQERTNVEINFKVKEFFWLFLGMYEYHGPNGRAVNFNSTILLVPGSNPVGNSYFFHIIFFWGDILLFKVPGSSSCNVCVDDQHLTW